MSKTVQLKILDEVNCKFVNLDLDARKYLVKKFKLIDPTARFRPAYKLGRWDGSVSFFGIGGSTYLSLLPDILKYLEDKNYYVEVEDQRNSIELKFEEIGEDFWGDRAWPEGHVNHGQPIRLRDYQVDIINKFLKNPQCLQSISTGAGKTILTATLAKICEQYGRTLTIVPSKSLVEQTEEDFVNCGLDVGVYYGDRKDTGNTHIISTWQSLNILEKKSKDSVDDTDRIKLIEFISGINTVVVDEAHGIKADVLKNLLTGALAHVPIRWGVTGTIPKEEISFMNLKVSLGEVIHEVKAKDLQERGVLADCHVSIIQTLEWKEFSNYAQELKFLVTDQTRMTYLAKLINDIAQTGNTLVLVDRIESGRFLQNYLEQDLKIPEVVFISGETKSKDRKSEYDEVKIANNKIIIATYGVAAVGINIVRLHNLVILEPGKSFVRVIQSIGRGLRKGHDKEKVEIYDITSTCKFSKKHLTKRKSFYNEAQYPFSIKKVNYTDS
jgi:superfamily II DNA or RNA helicase